MKKQKKISRLRTFNLLMAAFHFLQGILMLALSSDFALPIISSFLSFDTLTKRLAPAYSTMFHLRIGPVVALFFFLSCIAHLAVSLPGIHSWYSRNIKKGMNIARWVEYSVSSSVMMVIIAMLVGVYDIAALILLFTVNVGMIFFGWIMELHNQTTKKTNWTSYIFGCILGIVPWIIVTMYLIGSISGSGGPPNFVYGIFFSIFLFFSIFAVNMALQYGKIGPWKNYLYGEYVYIILSLVAKSLLAWQVWAGTLRPV